MSLPGLTGQSSTHGRCLLDRPVEPGDDDELQVKPLYGAASIRFSGAAAAWVMRLRRGSSSRGNSSTSRVSSVFHSTKSLMREFSKAASAVAARNGRLWTTST